MGDEGQDALEGHRGPAPPRHSTPSAVPQGEGCEGPGHQLTVFSLPTFPLLVTSSGRQCRGHPGLTDEAVGTCPRGHGGQQSQESERGGGHEPSHAAGSQDRALASAQSRLDGSALPLASCVTWDKTLKTQASAFSAVKWGRWPASQGADDSHGARSQGLRAAPGAFRSRCAGTDGPSEPSRWIRASPMAKCTMR